MKYKFDDMVVNSTTKKKPEESDRLHYIGLEHIDSGTFEISRWGADAAPISDKLIMKKGDILFGKRRAYQRKVAIAPFDGIFSAHGMVLRPKEDVICKEYFPFFVSSNQFMDTAVRISVGGLSPTVNWKDLQKQEFELPSIEEQRVLADKLWAAYNLKEAYKKMIAATDEMVKSQFIEMISGSAEWKSLNEITTYIGKGIAPKYVDYSNIAVINQACVYWTGIHTEHVKFHDVSVVLKKAYLEDFDILLNSTGRGTLGRICLFINPKDERLYITDGHVSVIKVDRNTILPEVLVAYFSLADVQNEIYRQYVTGSTNQIDIVFSEIRKMIVPIPNIEKQKQFVEITKQADKSKFELKLAIDKIDKVIKSLLQ